MIDFSDIEFNSAEFRAEQLYFIRLAATYVQSIFWDAFHRRTKNAKRRRKQVMALAQTSLTRKEDQDAILHSVTRHAVTSEFLKSGIVKNFLKQFPDEFQTVLVDRLNLHHAIFLSFDDFTKLLERLMMARGYREHFSEKIQKQESKTVSDEQMITDLFSLLPPHFHNLFIGCVESRVKQAAWPEIRQKDLIDRLQQFSKAIIQKRRQDNKRLFSNEQRRSQHDKAKRKSLRHENQHWYPIFKKHCWQHKDDYREFEFKLRYHFMGHQNFNQIVVYLSPSGAYAPKFKREIEEFYYLTARINLIIAQYINKLKHIDAGTRKRPDYKVVGADDIETARLRQIRNTIAHNGLFWRVLPDKNAKWDQSMPVQEIFQILVTAIYRDCGYETAHHFINAIEGKLKLQDYSLVDKRDDLSNQPHEVKEWTDTRRKKYSIENGYEIDHRRAVRRRVREWTTVLQSMRQILKDWKKNDRKTAGWASY